jgi:hypothetical protein
MFASAGPKVDLLAAGYDGPDGASGMAMFKGRTKAASAQTDVHICKKTSRVTGYARRSVPRLCGKVVVLIRQPGSVYDGDRRHTDERDAVQAAIDAAEPAHEPDRLLEILTLLASALNCGDCMVTGLGAATLGCKPAGHTPFAGAWRILTANMGLPQPNTDYVLFDEDFEEQRRYDSGMVPTHLAALPPEELYSIAALSAAMHMSAASLVGLAKHTLKGHRSESWNSLSAHGAISEVVQSLGSGTLAAPWCATSSALNATLSPALRRVWYQLPELGAGRMPAYSRWEVLDLSEASRPSRFLPPSGGQQISLLMSGLQAEFSCDAATNGMLQTWFLLMNDSAKRGMMWTGTAVRRGLGRELTYADMCTAIASAGQIASAQPWHSGALSSWLPCAASDLYSIASLPRVGPGGVAMRYSVRANPSASLAEASECRAAFKLLDLLMKMRDEIGDFRYMGTGLTADNVSLKGERYRAYDNADFDVAEPVFLLRGPAPVSGVLAAPPAISNFGEAGLGLAGPRGNLAVGPAQAGPDAAPAPDAGGDGEG